MSEKENSKAQIEQNLSHTHTHSHEHTKEVSNRLARAIGHLQKVKQMVENGDDCSDVLIQLAAVKSALNNTGKVILKDHLDHCIVHAVEKGDTAMLDEFNKAIDKFVKQNIMIIDFEKALSILRGKRNTVGANTVRLIIANPTYF